MTHEEKLAALTEAIVKAVPEITTSEGHRYYFGTCGRCGLRSDETDSEDCSRPITLEDVLIALQPRAKLIDVNLSKFAFQLLTADEEAEWKLGASLDNQSPETIDFLHSLLP